MQRRLRCERPSMSPLLDTAATIARGFLGAESDVSARPLGHGLVNDSFLVSSARGTFVLQRINTAVFPNAAGIMANLARLQALVTERPQAGLRLPRMIPAPDGRMLLGDADGGCWRLMEYIAGSRVLTRIDSDAQAREIGGILGRFHRLATDLDPGSLAITLPGFHDTPAYLDQLAATRRNTPVDDAQVTEAVAFIEARQDPIGRLAQAHAQGLLPLRVTHGDPKIDNLLFARDRDQALCLIDLDTVQPGLVHHDIGDCLRSCCNRRGESAAGDVRFDLDTCRGILSGYAQASRGLLSPAEIGLLYPAIRLLPLELGIRFLTDHLQGDHWFRVRAPGQNLAKARVQLALVADIEAKRDDIERIIRDCFVEMSR